MGVRWQRRAAGWPGTMGHVLVLVLVLVGLSGTWHHHTKALGIARTRSTQERAAGGRAAVRQGEV